MVFSIVYHPLVLTQDLPKIDPEIRARIRRAINFRLSKSPEVFGKPLQFSFKGFWSLRVGDWRVVYQIKKSEVWVLRIRHRREVYKQPLRDLE